MERIISDEEKLRKAIEISQRRNNNNYYYKEGTTKINTNDKKDYKLFKKMILQIIICLLIYIIFYLISSTNYVFSADVIKNTKEILNYDIDFTKIYSNVMSFINSNNNFTQTEENNVNLNENNTIKNNNEIVQNNTENVSAENNNSVENENVVEENNNSTKINNAEEQNEDKDKKENKDETEKNDEENTDTQKEETASKTQMEKDAEAAKKVCKFSLPLSGTITSEFGAREATIKGMTTDHKGIDIAANSGTNIKSAMAGTVKVAEENSEYGKFIKIVNGDVMTVYAHCQKLKVKVGDKIKAGQTIATVGSTGNSTGPHLHFEIRFENRYINPKLLIEF